MSTWFAAVPHGKKCQNFLISFMKRGWCCMSSQLSKKSSHRRPLSENSWMCTTFLSCVCVCVRARARACSYGNKEKTEGMSCYSIFIFLFI